MFWALTRQPHKQQRRSFVSEMRRHVLCVCVCSVSLSYELIQWIECSIFIIEDNKKLKKLLRNSRRIKVAVCIRNNPLWFGFILFILLVAGVCWRILSLDCFARIIPSALCMSRLMWVPETHKFYAVKTPKQRIRFTIRWIFAAKCIHQFERDKM